MSRFHTLEVSDARFALDGLRHFTVKSPALGGRADASFWVPPHAPPHTPLVILLHGVYGSHWAWALKGAAHHTARDMIDSGEIPPLILVMPSDGLWGDGSAYVPHAHADFERWIVEEVPAVMRLILGPEALAPRFFLCGLSMGGYGAIRLGARHSALCAGISAHSAITEPSQFADFLEEDPAFLSESGSALAHIQTAGDAMPPFRFDCGLGDPLLAANRTLHACLLQLDIPHHYEELEGGHEWPYWETHLPRSYRHFARQLRH